MAAVALGGGGGRHVLTAGMRRLARALQVFIMQAGFAMLCAGHARGKNMQNILSKNMADCAIGTLAFYTIGTALAFGNGEGSNGFIGVGDWALSSTNGATVGDNSYHVFFFHCERSVPGACAPLPHATRMRSWGLAAQPRGRVPAPCREGSTRCCRGARARGQGMHDMAPGAQSHVFRGPYRGIAPAGAFSAAAATIVAGAVAERMSFGVYLAGTALMTSWTYPVAAHWLWTQQGWLSAHK